MKTPWSTMIIIFTLICLCVFPYAAGWNLEYLQSLSIKLLSPFMFLGICIFATVAGYVELQIRGVE
jgi:hypothetical protein